MHSAKSYDGLSLKGARHRQRLLALDGCSGMDHGIAYAFVALKSEIMCLIFGEQEHPYFTIIILTRKIN